MPQEEVCKPFALISIKPRYADLFLEGTKVYEYRKRSMRRLLGMDTLIYATYPRCKIVGKMVLMDETFGFKDRIWGLTDTGAGILWWEYKKYYEGYEYAYAGCFDSVQAIKGPTLDEIKDRLKDRQWVPPQSWIFFNGHAKQRKGWGLE